MRQIRKKIKIIIIFLIILMTIVCLCCFFNNDIRNRFIQYVGLQAENIDTIVDYNLDVDNGVDYNITFDIQNNNGIEKVILPDITIDCNNKKQVGFDRTLVVGEIYTFRVKTKDNPVEEVYKYVATQNPNMQIVNFDTNGDGLTRTIALDFGNINNTSHYYSTDNGLTWQEYTGPVDVENADKENFLGKIVYNEDICVNKPESYFNKIDNVHFKKTEWTNGKPLVTLDSINKEYIEYQINGTDGEWIKGYKIINLNNNDTIYARINNGTYILDERSKQIVDDLPPNSVNVTVNNIKYKIATVNVDAKDLETGILNYKYIIEKDGELVYEKDNIVETSKKIDGLEEETKYVAYVIAYDKVGNSKQSKKVEFVTPKFENYLAIDMKSGDNVNLGTNYVDKSWTLKNGSKPTVDWRVLYKDEEQGNVYLIFTGMLRFRYNYNVVKTDFSNRGVNGNYPFSWMSNMGNRTRTINELKDTNKWNRLISSNYISNGFRVKGALTVEEFIKAWKARGYSGLEARYVTSGFNATGYVFGSNLNPSSYEIDLRSNSGVNDILFFPYSSIEDCYGYWIMNEAAYSGKAIVTISTSGTINGRTSYDNVYYSVRPVVIVPGDTEMRKNVNTGIWEVILD